MHHTYIFGILIWQILLQLSLTITNTYVAIEVFYLDRKFLPKSSLTAGFEHCYCIQVISYFFMAHRCSLIHKWYLVPLTKVISINALLAQVPLHHQQTQHVIQCYNYVCKCLVICVHSRIIKLLNFHALPYFLVMSCYAFM